LTTKELIELLQQADPDGTSHVRLTGGIPRYVVYKEDDEPYHYIDDDGNFITQTDGGKVDIFCDDVFEYVLNKHTIGHSLEEIKNMFIFDDNVSTKYEYIIMTEVKESFNLIDKNIKELYDESLLEMRENALNGWEWFEKISDNYTPRWIIKDENGIKILPHISNTAPIINSGEWIETHNNKINGYKEWIYEGNISIK